MCILDIIGFEFANDLHYTGHHVPLKRFTTGSDTTGSAHYFHRLNCVLSHERALDVLEYSMLLSRGLARSQAHPYFASPASCELRRGYCGKLVSSSGCNRLFKAAAKRLASRGKPRNALFKPCSRIFSGACLVISCSLVSIWVLDRLRRSQHDMTSSGILALRGGTK